MTYQRPRPGLTTGRACGARRALTLARSVCWPADAAEVEFGPILPGHVLGGRVCAAESHLGLEADVAAGGEVLRGAVGGLGEKGAERQIQQPEEGVLYVLAAQRDRP